MKRELWLNRVAIGVFAVAFLWHWSYIWLFAVDIPFSDDWGNFPKAPYIPWLFDLHNEHRIVTTRILILALWKFDGWNLAFHQILNFAIYGGVLLCLLPFARQTGMPLWVALGFLLFPLSPLPYENHTWATQTQWHLVLIFFFGCAYGLLLKAQTWRALVGGTLSGILAMYSLSAGLVGVGILWLFFLALKIHQLQRRDERRLTWRQLIGVSLGLVGAGGLYFLNYHKPENHPPFAFPWSREFWDYFSTLFSIGFGMPSPASVWLKGFFTLGLCLFPLVFEGIRCARRRQRPSHEFASVAALILGLVVILASIAAGRGGLGVEQARSPRYCEFVLMLYPLIAFALWEAFRSYGHLRCWLLGVLWLAFAVTLTRPGNWNRFQHYEQSYLYRTAQISALHKRFVANEPCKCKGLVPGTPIQPEALRRYDAMGLSFMRQVKSGQTELTSPLR